MVRFGLDLVGVLEPRTSKSHRNLVQTIGGLAQREAAPNHLQFRQSQPSSGFQTGHTS